MPAWPAGPRRAAPLRRAGRPAGAWPPPLRSSIPAGRRRHRHSRDRAGPRRARASRKIQRHDPSRKPLEPRFAAGRRAPRNRQPEEGGRAVSTGLASYPREYQNPEQSPRDGKWFVAAVMLLYAALHLAAINSYGWFRDELYYIACGEHLDFG